MDGTLLDSTGTLRPAVVDAVRAISRSGVRVVLATGRSPWFGVAEIAARLGLFGPQITMQGALVSDPESGRILRSRPLQPALFREALRFAAECGVDPIIATLEGHCAARRPAGVDFLGPQAADAGRLSIVADLESIAECDPMRVFISTPPARHPAVLAAARRHFGSRASIIWSDLSGLEVVAPGTNKATAVAWLAAALGIGLDEVAAVGDGANDIELLQAVGRSAAVGPRLAAVREAAEIVVPDADSDGVLVAFRAFGLPPAASAARPPQLGAARLAATPR